MKLILSLSLFFLSITLSSLLAQTHHEYCAQHHVHQKWLRRDIKYKKKHNEMEAILLQASQNKQLSKSQSVITLPVVFHIIHDNGVENIPAERIDQELENLNAAFANTGYYNPATGVDVEVQFCLASRTPEGMPFDGINRVQSPLTEFNYNTQEVAVKTLSRFDALQYINIWVVREVCSNNGCNAVAGYAYLPGAHGRTIDGIVLEAEFVGLTEARSTVLIHEMGHYLGLYHTFERGCGNNDCQSSGDRVCDTPPDNTVANVPCSDPSNSCNTDADDTSINNPFRPVAEGGLGDQPDQIQNYMDYSRQACYDRFTQGQKERMINVINNIRSSLLSSPACLPPCDNPVAAEFTVPNNSISVGEPLIFTNNSQNANRFEWYVNENLVSTVRDLNYTFTDGGNFTVRLLAYSADQDCIVKSFETIVKVNCVLEANIDLTTPIFNIGDSIVISTSTGKSTNINWQINNLAVSTDSSFTFIGSEAGIYQVCLELTEGNCQSQTCTFISVVDPLEEATCGQSLFYELLHSGILNILSMIPASDDAFYVGGILEDESADPAFLMKFSNAGNLLWQVRISTGLNNVEFNHMVEDGDFLVGILSSSVDGSHIFKLNTNTQDLVWMKWVAERSFYTSRVFLNDGNYVVLGEYQSLFDLNDPITSNYLIVDSDNGDLISSTAYGFGNLSNSVDAVQIESNIYAVGYSRLADGARLGMTSYAENGTINWSKTYIENSSQNNGLFIQNMDKDDNALILTGGASSFNRINFVIKTNLEGEIIWAKELNLPEFSSYGLTAVYTTEDAYWVTGTAATLSSRIGAFCFIKLDKDGNILSANYIPSVNLNRRIIGINPFFNTPKGFYQDRSITSILNPTLTTTPSFIRFVDNQDNCFPLWETTAVANDLTGIVADDFSPTPVNKVINVANAVSPLVENGQLVINNTCNCSLTEICDDGIDNDLDNIVDCLDTDCNCESDCGEEFVLTSAQNDHPEGIYAVGQGVDKKFLTLGFRDQTYILSKVDQTGNALWVKNLDFDSNLGFDDFRANEIFLNDDGFIYLILNGSNLLKYDTTAHQVLWAKQFFVTGSFLSTQLLNIEEDPTTNRLFAYLSFTQIDAEAVVEIDKSDGSVLWETVLSPSDFTTIRGGGFVQSDFTAYNGQIAIINYRSQDIGSVIFLDDDGQFGSSFNTLTNGGFSGDFRFRSAQLLENSLLIAFEARENGTTKAIPALMEVSRLGTVRWVKEYNFSGFDASTFEYDFQVIDDGYLILGSVGNNNSVKNSLLFKVDKDGNGQWASSLGNRDNYILHNSRTGQKVVIDSSGVFLASSIIQNGNLNRQSLFIKMDEQGQLPSNTCSFQRNLEWTQKNGPRYRFIDIEFSESQTPVERDELTVTVSDAPPSATSFLCAPQECCPIDLGINIDTAFCNGDSLTISLYIKNVADSTFNGIVPVSFYDKNPTLDSSSFLLTTKQTATLSLLPEDSTQVVFQVPYPTSQVFAVVNDNALNLTPFVLSDSTFTGFYEECIYENNLDSIDFERPILTLDLGADTTVCENSAILLDAGPGFESYQWPDATIEQTYTAFETGIFTVEAFDICNTLYTDTIVIQLDTAIGIAIDPPIAFICPADSALLQIPILPDYTYQWFDANDQTICEGCQEIYVSPDQSTTYTVVATNTSGCVSADSILVNILDCEQVVELMVCEGESTSFAGQPFTAGEQDTMLINDTLFLIRVMQFPEAIETRDTFICPGSSVFFEGVELFAGSSTPFQYTSVNGCDSTFVLSVLEDPPIATQEEIGFCAGDSVLVFGQSVSETGSYSQNFIAANGCDSVHTIIVAPLATPEINVPDGFINCLSGTGALEVEIAPDIPILTVFWSTIESSRRIQNLQTGDYSVTVTALNGCTATSQGTVLESFADVTAEVFSNNISCFGANDGQISILNPNGGVPPYRFSLNGAPFSNQNSFEGLSEGNYRVEVRDANDCGTVFDIFIDEPSPLSVSLPAEIIVPLGDTIVLNPDIQSDRTLNYSWEPTTNLSCSNCPTPSLSPSENQQYTLFISDSVNCQASASVFIRLNRAGRIFIPNVFSPNGDGINDIFGIFMDNSVDRINTIRIYNRWGSAVFQRSNVDKAAAAALWDGTINGTELPSGTYVYSLEVTYLDGFTEVLSGEISLIR